MGGVCSEPVPRPEVQVATGWLRGTTHVSAQGTKYHAFLGIPYGKPPIDELRFKAPVAAEPWSGVRDASVEGNISFHAPTRFGPSVLSFMQICRILLKISEFSHQASIKPDEDCLYLNVFVPVCAFPDCTKDSTTQTKLPVLFWIHGGGFRSGNSNPGMMSPELFLDRNIVVVTMNYRLGPFGFLALGTTDVPGNAGLKDQLLALRWTHDNIKAFGGDPKAVTVYGESAGGLLLT